MDEESRRPRQASRGIQLGRYVVSVDGQAKSGYPQKDAADAQADKIRKAFPRVSVTVTDAMNSGLVSAASDIPSVESAETNQAG